MKEKWSKGTYIVPLQNKLLSRNGFVTAYKPYQIISSTPSLPFIIDDNGNKVNFVTTHEESEVYHGIRWFETKEEAEEFAKTLAEPVRDEYTLDMHEEMKQTLKQAVHCKTQEEWDFVCDKNGYSFKSSFKNITAHCIRLDREINSSGGLQWCKDDNYQILSFQEWCDLHGYKMEKEVKFEVGDWVIITKSNQNWNDCMDRYVGKVVKITSISSSTSIEFEGSKYWSFLATNGHFRHATPIEINNHLISIGQIPTIEGINKTQQLIKQLKLDALSCMTKHPYYGVIENPCKDVYSRGQFRHDTNDIKVPEPWKSKTILSIDDEELPMISIIKTNTIKQLLNND